jgi:structural maintenance of chromosome 2
LEQEVVPKLDKLKEAKRTLIEFQAIEAELNKTTKLIVAHDYDKYSRKINQADKDYKELQEQIQNQTSLISMLEDELKELETEFQAIIASRQKDGSLSSTLEVECKEKGQDLARLKAVLANNEALISDEMSSIAACESNLSESEAAIKTAQDAVNSLAKDCKETIQQHEETSDSIKNLENIIQAITTGLSSNQGQDNGYIDQLSSAKKVLMELSSEIDQNRVRLSYLEKQLSEANPKAKKAMKEFGSLNAEIEQKRNQVDTAKAHMESLHVDREREINCEAEHNSVSQQLTECLQEIELLSRSTVGIQFTFADPVPNFDKSLVKGLVAELVDIPTDNLDSSVALEICAGGKLYNVVIENEIVGSQLLSKGKLKRRVTFIPLNKINGNVLSADRVSKAKQIAPGKVELAYALIKEKPEISAALKYVFGNTLIARDNKSAKDVTFNKDVRARSVTFDGDVYDPSGQLSGGAKSSNTGLLAKMQQLRVLEDNQKRLLVLQSKCLAQLQDVQEKNQSYSDASQLLEMRKHELNLLETRLSNNPHFKLVKNVEDLNSEIKLVKERIVQCEEKSVSAAEKVRFLEKEMQELTENRDAKLDNLKKQVLKERTLVEKLNPKVREMQQQMTIANEEYGIFNLQSPFIKRKDPT